MIIENFSEVPLSKRRAHAVVVGAGAAGISLALELESAGLTTILIEGGGFSFSDDSQSMYDGVSVGVPLPYGLMGSRLRYFGGSTNCWGGGCGELDEEDFTQRSWVGGSGWPFSKSTLLPWYKRAEEFLSLTGPASTPDMKSDGFQYINGLETKCLSPTPVLRFGRHFRRHLEQSDHITVLLSANFRHLFKQSEEGRADSCQVVTHAGAVVDVEGDYFVFACGGIENARLLLNQYELDDSVIAPNRLTGRYFADHPLAPAASLIGYSRPAPSATIVVNEITSRSPGGSVRLPYYKLPFDVQEKYGVLNGVVQFGLEAPQVSTAASAAWRVLNWARGNTSALDFADLKNALSEPAELIKAVYARSQGGTRLAMRFQIEQSPNINSSVSLSSKKDHIGLRVAQLDWRHSDLERRTVDSLIDYVGSCLFEQRLGVLRADEFFSENINGLPRDLRGGQHHSGTTRMAATKQEGVVDENLKLFGAQNVYVVGSSVFPTNGWVNPTHTIIALSMRLASHISKLRRLMATTD